METQWFPPISINELTAKSTDPTIVARATTYSGNVVRIVHVFSDEALVVNAEHYNTMNKSSHVDVQLLKLRKSIIKTAN